MPTGVIINATSVFLGGIIGSCIKDKLNQNIKNDISLIFGVCSIAMGINSIGLMENMPAVIFAIIIGTLMGLLFKFGYFINKSASLMQKPINQLFKTNASVSKDDFLNQLVTVIVLFCASGTGIYGALTAGMTGDHSILVAKSILDFFTALIFSCQLGLVVSLIALPQFIILTILFCISGIILPLTSPYMINDFKACGGVIMLATGFRMMKIKNLAIADMIPSMIIVMPFSYFWVNYIVTFLK